VHYVDEVSTKLAAAIGARVKQERRARDWTLDRLAEVAGVSRRMVVSVEQGSVNPSVGTLLRLSDALGIGLPALVEPPELHSVKVTRSGEGAELWTGTAGGRGVLVAGTRAPDVVELWDWSLGPGDSHETDAHATGTKELLHVLEGTVTVDVADRLTILEVGDALTFPGDLPHTYANTGTSPARFSLAVFEPGVGTSVTRKQRNHEHP
jgi:transcriptional regulator with XRE-family HTH domain